MSRRLSIDPQAAVLPVLLAVSLLATPAVRAEVAACPQLTDSLPPPQWSDDPRMILNADEVDLTSGGPSKLLGSVHLMHEDKEFTADQLDYDERSGRIDVNAESMFRNRSLLIRSKSAHFNLNDETGRFEDTHFVLSERAARGDAHEVKLGSDGKARLSDVRYTTCAEGSNAWYLQARSIKLDQQAGLGTARNVQLRFFGAPILYAPWFQFPIDNRRRTGVLFPTVGESKNTGWDVRVPVYINLAPNYDLTLTPRLMTDRGNQLLSRGRYLFDNSEGSIKNEFLSRDRQTDEQRSYTEFDHRALLGPHLGLIAHFAEVSDQNYFEDLGGNVDQSSITHLDRSARLTYNQPAAYTVRALVQDYQTVSSNISTADEPYRRLPQIRIDAVTQNALFNTRLGGGAEYVYFAKDGAVEGQRIDLDPFLRMETDRVAWYGKSQLDYRYTAYDLNGTAPGQSAQVDRTLPVFSTEYGLRFERLAAGGAPQTVEPRLFYLYVPRVNQDDLPVFDSGEPDFDFTQLFARNRFSGIDRLSDANHVALALTGRQLDRDSGEVRAEASLGQLYRLTAPRTALPGTTPPEQGATDFLGSLAVYPLDRWSFGTDLQWSPQNDEFTRSSVNLRYKDGQRVAQLAYRYRQDLLRQTDLIIGTPLPGGFSLIGRWRYSLPDRASLDTVASVQYESCCWAIRASYRRYVANTSGRFDSGIYLQLQLKGLARLGSGLTNLFPEDVVEQP